MSITDLIFGRPLKLSEEKKEKIGPAGGVAIFGLDALGSAAYGPEAALTLLIPLGSAGINYIVPITATIIILLLILYFSYRQTISEYPTGEARIPSSGKILECIPVCLLQPRS